MKTLFIMLLSNVMSCNLYSCDAICRLLRKTVACCKNKPAIVDVDKPAAPRECFGNLDMLSCGLKDNLGAERPGSACAVDDERPISRRNSFYY